MLLPFVFIGLVPWFLAIAFFLIAAFGILIKEIYFAYGLIGLSLLVFIPMVISVTYFIVKSAKKNF
jgi:hypothetical protein